MNTREYIVNVLMRVVYEHGYAGLIMRNEKNIPEADMPFVSEAVYGVLRNYEYLEAQWHRFAKKASKRNAILLDFGIYQMFFMDSVPAYAAVNETVRMGGRERGFINAVLHKVMDAGLTKAEGNGIRETAERTSHPLWLMNMWKAHYGEETAVMIAEADQRRRPVTGRINTLRTAREELEKDQGVHFLNEISFRYDGQITKMMAFREGKVLVQDYHSALVPLLLDVKPGMKVLDTCAAPGTKTQETAMLMKNEGSITACDLYEARCSLIDRLMSETGVSIVSSRQMDASQPGNFEEETFDRILIDAPCSGLGDLSRKPEIRLHLKPENIDELVKTQAEILSSCSAYLKKGGRLVYSTCTLNRKENENQIKAFLKNHEDFVLISEKTMFPFEEDSDGFYAAVLERKGPDIECAQ